MCVVFTDKDGQPVQLTQYSLTEADDKFIAAVMKDAAKPLALTLEDIAEYNRIAERCGEQDRITDWKTEPSVPTAQPV